MTIRSLRTELGKLREQVGRAAPAPSKTPDVFERIRQYEKVFELQERGLPIPPELAEVAERAREQDRLLAEEWGKQRSET